MGVVGRAQRIYCDAATTPTRTSPLQGTECANAIHVFVSDAAATAAAADDDGDGDDDELK